MKNLLFIFAVLLPWVCFAGYGPDSPQWYSVNDSVMGGISVGGPVKLEYGVVRFAGILSLENNGGFSSIRAESDAFALQPGKEIVLTVKGDGRRYYLDLRTNRRQRAFTYRQGFQTKAGEMIEIRLPLAGFEATRFGRRMLNAAPLKPEDIGSVGITLSDKKPGPFRVDILSMETADPEPVKAGSVEDLLELAIKRGVPLYNRGDMDACASIYELALRSLLLMPEETLSPASRKMVESTMTGARNVHSADERAWMLRRGIDAVMMEL